MKWLARYYLGGVLMAAVPAARSAESNPQPLDLPKFVVTDRPVVELPPFVVTGMSLGNNWRYAAIPGFEIISQCSDVESRNIVAAIIRGRQLMLAPKFWVDFAAPMTVVLFNQPPVSSGQPTSLGKIRGPGETGTHWTNLIKRTQDDRESFALNLWPRSFFYTSTFRFHTRTLLRRRAPAVPAWLNEGLMGHYGVYREGVYWFEESRTKLLIASNWYTQEVSKNLREVAGRAAKELAKPVGQIRPSALSPFLMELGPLFEAEPPGPDDPAAPRWACTAALFIRWCLYGQDHPARAEQFWDFADRVSREPATEQIFREYFGRSYADVEAELSWYLPRALLRQEGASADLPLPPKIKFRDATNNEVARVRGEWERMEAVALDADYPDLARGARAQVSATLQRAYKSGDRDPRLLASVGLLAMDSGDYVSARNQLEAAIAGQVIGPRVYLEAARLRWAEAMLDESGRLPPSTLAGVIDLLMTAEQQGPPIAAVYLLLANATLQAPLVTPAQAEALRRGQGYFPRMLALHERINATLHR